MLHDGVEPLRLCALRGADSHTSTTLRQDYRLAGGEALDDGPGSAGRATLYTGARGAGKTVLLNAVEDAARARGWLLFVAETATPGLPRLLAEHDPDALKRRLSGFGLPARS